MCLCEWESVWIYLCVWQECRRLYHGTTLIITVKYQKIIAKRFLDKRRLLSSYKIHEKQRGRKRIIIGIGAEKTARITRQIKDMVQASDYGPVIIQIKISISAQCLYIHENWPDDIIALNTIGVYLWVWACRVYVWLEIVQKFVDDQKIRRWI